MLETFLSFNFLYLSVTFWCSTDTMICKTLNTVKSFKSIEMTEESLYLSVAVPTTEMTELTAVHTQHHTLSSGPNWSLCLADSGPWALCLTTLL